jgi:phage host-nuclease inhibitor protein Gam
MKTGKKLIKEYCDNILYYEGTLEYGSVRTLGDIKREVDKLYTQAEYDAAVKTAFISGMLTIDADIEDAKRTAEGYIKELKNG